MLSGDTVIDSEDFSGTFILSNGIDYITGMCCLVDASKGSHAMCPSKMEALGIGESGVFSPFSYFDRLYDVGSVNWI